MNKKVCIKIRLSLFIFCFMGLSTCFSQGVPSGMNFQATVKDSTGAPAKNKVIYIQDAIIQTTPDGAKVFIETYKITSSPEGVITITIGQGTWLSGVGKLTEIDWRSGPYYLNIKAAIEPVTFLSGWIPDDHYVDIGTSQFWAVPFAFSAAKVEGYELFLKATDTTAMLLPYLRTVDTSSISKRINDLSQKITELSLLGQVIPKDTVFLRDSFLFKTDTAFIQSVVSNYLLLTDTASMLLPYLRKSDTVNLDNMLGLKLNIRDTASMLSNYYKSAMAQKDLALKEPSINKSVDVKLGPSNVLFPTQKAVKTYVDLSMDSLIKKIMPGDTVRVDTIVVYQKSPSVTAKRIIGNSTDRDGAANEIILGEGLSFAHDSLKLVNSITLQRDTFSHDITVYAANGLGKYNQGSVIPAKGKTAAEVLLDAVTQKIPPVYQAPNLTIGANPSPGAIEIGSTFAVTFSANFLQNDAGPQTSITFYKNGSSLAANSDNIISLTSNVSYTATVNFATGAVKNDNLGTPDPTGQITSGNISAAPINYIPQSKRYWGYCNSVAPSDAEILAALGGGNELATSRAKNSFDINISSGVNYIFFAYPVSFGSLSGMSVSGFGSLPAFTKTSRVFVNAKGFAQSYNIYVSQNTFSVPVLNIITN